MKNFLFISALMSSSFAAVTRWSQCPDLTGIFYSCLTRRNRIFVKASQTLNQSVTWVCGTSMLTFLRFSKRGLLVGGSSTQTEEPKWELSTSKLITCRFLAKSIPEHAGTELGQAPSLAEVQLSQVCQQRKLQLHFSAKHTLPS